jgi:flagellar hook assembly protein FlgD
LPDGENVKVEVYNPLGQLVRTLVNGYKTGGQHSVLWDGADETGQKMASGVYLCKVTAGKQEMLRRMLLLK